MPRQQSDVDHHPLADLLSRQVATINPGTHDDGLVTHADPFGEALPGHERRSTVQLLRVESFRIHPLCSTMIRINGEPLKHYVLKHIVHHRGVMYI